MLSYKTSIQAIQQELPVPNPFANISLQNSPVQLKAAKERGQGQYKVTIDGINAFTFVGILQSNDCFIKKEAPS